MNDYFQLRGPAGADSNAPTVDYAYAESRKAHSARRCNVALPGGGLSQDIGCVLRRRLLIAALITAIGFTIFFIRSLFGTLAFFEYREWDLVFHGCVSALLVLIATLLASHLPFSVRQLRLIELTLFGSIAAYFAWLQLVIYSHGNLLQWAAAGHESDFLALANAGNVLRWFALIVIYGTFVPNTWKRSAVFVGIFAAIPLAMTVLVCFGCPRMGHFVPESLLTMGTMLGIAATIAIFGSYKISELQQEAIEAKQLGQYQLKEKIGSGGMGEVFLGEHIMLRRKCAVKIIRPEHNMNLTNMSRFEREVKAMARLTHWNSVEVYDYGMSEDGVFYYVMEYLPGMSLQELVEKHGPLTPGRTVHFLRQIGDALQEAHAMNLIHRDIKPSNVLATSRGGVQDVAKLLDFGLVQSVGFEHDNPRLTSQGMVLGSPPFMSPEQALGKRDIDARSDIYSIGGLAYFLLTGQPPFERETAMQILMAHVHDEVTPPSDYQPEIPADLEAIVLQCLAKKPEDRFTDVESLQDALAECSSALDWTRHTANEWWDVHTQPQRLAPAMAGQNLD